MPHGEQLDIFSAVLDGYSGFFSRTPRFELSRKSVENFTVTLLMLHHALQVIWLDILSDVSRSVNSIVCRTCQGVIHRQFV